MALPRAGRSHTLRMFEQLLCCVSSMTIPPARSAAFRKRSTHNVCKAAKASQNTCPEYF